MNDNQLFGKTNFSEKHTYFPINSQRPQKNIYFFLNQTNESHLKKT